MASSQSINKLGAHQEKVPAYWIFVPALLLSSYVLWMAVHYQMESFVFVLSAGALTLAASGMALRRMGQRIAASVCAVVVLACYWVPVSLLVFAMSGKASAFILVAYYAFVIVPLGVLALFATGSFARTAGTRWAASAVALAVVPSFALGIVSVINQQSRLPVHPRPADPFVLKDDLLAIDKCTQQFASNHPKDGYPTSLSQLGPNGTQCLSAELVNPIRGEFTIVYEPGARDPDGKIESYSLRAQETKPRSEYQSTAYSSESGLECYRFDGPSGQGRPMLLYYPGNEFWTAMNCLWEGGSTGWSIGVGDSQVLSGRDAYLSRCVPNATAVSADAFILGPYRYENKYRFSIQDQSNVIGFELSVRPLSYGQSGLRSYLAVGTFTEDGGPRTLYVYATPKDRPATTDDPLALAQEVSSNLSQGEASWEWCGGKLCE